jgi:hypothetical protein
VAIDGVTDGDLVNHAIVPTVTVTDAHLHTSELRLNGADFVSGTSIGANGDYTLSVQADDLAGNATVRSLHFRIDREAPTLSFTNPAAAAILSAPTVTVVGQTEAMATVHFVAGKFSVDVGAGNDGVFVIADVPLQPGANTFLAHATDAAGNVGSDVSRSVTYQPGAGASVEGQLGTLPASLRAGTSLDASYSLHNSGSVDTPGLALRLDLRRAGDGISVRQDDFQVDLAAGANANGQRSVTTNGLASGPYQLVLLAELVDAMGHAAWQVLDTKTTAIAASCQQVSDRIFANGFDAVADEIFCDGFEGAAEARTVLTLAESLAPATYADTLLRWRLRVALWWALSRRSDHLVAMAPPSLPRPSDRLTGGAP